MIDGDHRSDPPDRAELADQDLAIATLVGCYIERREPGQPPFAHDLSAVAAEFGDAAVDALRAVLARYEAMSTYDERTRTAEATIALGEQAEAASAVETVPLAFLRACNSSARWDHADAAAGRRPAARQRSAASRRVPARRRPDAEPVIDP